MNFASRWLNFGSDSSRSYKKLRTFSSWNSFNCKIKRTNQILKTSESVFSIKFSLVIEKKKSEFVFGKWLSKNCDNFKTLTNPNISHCIRNQKMFQVTVHYPSYGSQSKCAKKCYSLNWLILIRDITGNSWHYSFPCSVYCRSIVFLVVV